MNSPRSGQSPAPTPRPWFLDHLSPELVAGLAAAPDYPYRDSAHPWASAGLDLLLYSSLPNPQELSTLLANARQAIKSYLGRVAASVAVQPLEQAVSGVLLRELAANVLDHAGRGNHGVAILGSTVPVDRLLQLPPLAAGKLGTLDHAVPTIELFVYDTGPGLIRDLRTPFRRTLPGGSALTGDEGDRILAWAFSPAASRKSPEQRRRELAAAFGGEPLRLPTIPPTGLFFVAEQCRQLNATLQMFANSYACEVDFLRDGVDAQLLFKRRHRLPRKAQASVTGKRSGRGVAIRISIPLLPDRIRLGLASLRAGRMLDHPPDIERPPERLSTPSAEAEDLADELLHLRRRLSIRYLRQANRRFLIVTVPTEIADRRPILAAYLSALSVHQSHGLRVVALVPSSWSVVAGAFALNPTPAAALPLFGYSIECIPFLATPGERSLATIPEPPLPPPPAELPASLPIYSDYCAFGYDAVGRGRYALVAGAALVRAEWATILSTALQRQIDLCRQTEDGKTQYLLPSGVFCSLFFDLRSFAEEGVKRQLWRAWLTLHMREIGAAYVVLVGWLSIEALSGEECFEPAQVIKVPLPDDMESWSVGLRALSGHVAVVTDAIASGATMRTMLRSLSNALSVSVYALVASQRSAESFGVLTAASLADLETSEEVRREVSKVEEVDSYTHALVNRADVPSRFTVPVLVDLATPGTEACLAVQHRKGPGNHTVFSIDMDRFMALNSERHIERLAQLRSELGISKWDDVIGYVDSPGIGALAEQLRSVGLASRIQLFERALLRRRGAEGPRVKGPTASGHTLLLDDVVSSGRSLRELGAFARGRGRASTTAVALYARAASANLYETWATVEAMSGDGHRVRCVVPFDLGLRSTSEIECRACGRRAALLSLLREYRGSIQAGVLAYLDVESEREWAPMAEVEFPMAPDTSGRRTAVFQIRQELSAGVNDPILRERLLEPLRHTKWTVGADGLALVLAKEAGVLAAEKDVGATYFRRQHRAGIAALAEASVCDDESTRVAIALQAFAMLDRKGLLAAKRRLAELAMKHSDETRRRVWIEYRILEAGSRGVEPDPVIDRLVGVPSPLRSPWLSIGAAGEEPGGRFFEEILFDATPHGSIARESRTLAERLGNADREERRLGCERLAVASEELLRRVRVWMVRMRDILQPSQRDDLLASVARLEAGMTVLKGESLAEAPEQEWRAWLGRFERSVTGGTANSMYSLLQSSFTTNVSRTLRHCVTAPLKTPSLPSPALQIEDDLVAVIPGRHLEALCFDLLDNFKHGLEGVTTAKPEFSVEARSSDEAGQKWVRIVFRTVGTGVQEIRPGIGTKMAESVAQQCLGEFKQRVERANEEFLEELTLVRIDARLAGRSA